MKKIFFVLTIAAALFTACAKKSATGGFSSNAQTAELKKTAVDYDMADAAAEYVVSNSVGTAEENGNTSAKDSNSKTSQRAERKLIYTGNISLEVENLANTKAAVEQWVKKYGGYISNSSESTIRHHFTVDVPQENFFAAMEESGSLGKVKNKNVNSRDVTEQFYDLQTRLETRHILLERLKGYLSTAKDMKDLIEVESKINSVTTDIEQMQGQMNRLQNQISFSQIDIDAHLPANRDEQGFVFPDVKEEASDLLSNVVSFFVHFIFVLIYIAIFGTPIVLAIILIYWITFGKIGLVRKLIDKIKK